MLGKPQAAKADGKWHRKETASGEDDSPETPAVRVKGWGKSPPASWRHGGSPNPVRCKANRFRYEAARPGTGLLPRGMVTQDRIRLIGLLRKKPWKRGFFYIPDSPATRQAHPASGVTAVSVEPPGTVARR